jgi:hypothetical protein
LEHGSNGKASVRPQVQFSVTEKKDWKNMNKTWIFQMTPLPQ